MRTILVFAITAANFGLCALASLWCLTHLRPNTARVTQAPKGCPHFQQQENKTIWSDAARVPAGSLFARGENETNGWPDAGLKLPRILFGMNGNFGSQVIRNQMIASFLSAHFRDRVITTLWNVGDIVRGKKDVEVKRRSLRFDVCVGTKAYNHKFVNWCRQHGARYVHDVVDNLQFASGRVLRRIEVARRKNVTEAMPYPADILVVSTNFHRKLLERYLLQSTAVIPHQHTNIESETVSQPPDDEVALKRQPPSIAGPLSKGTVGFIFGVNNALSKNQLQQLRHVVCCKHGMRLKLINQELRGKRLHVSTKVWIHSCEASISEFYEYESGMPVSGFQRLLGRILSSEEFREMQQPFHNSTLIEDVDIALLWPPDGSTSVTFAARPVTRLVHWWSHGVPTIFFPYSAYTETAETYNYYGCDEMGLFGLRYLSHIAELGKWLDLLKNNDGLRQCLSTRGRKIAKHFTPSAIAAKFVSVLESMVYLQR
eukprot:gb/GECG01005920.1/.p1 GENE.gb/GECG01005920.1/~~gb/GECG01005920.1/.p1  ORF type:complete len:486 (+),score=31.81 gb/GECG01005920.1/:1-1458(+)